MWAAAHFFRLREQVPQPPSELQQEFDFHRAAVRMSKFGLLPDTQLSPPAHSQPAEPSLPQDHPRRRFWNLFQAAGESLPPFLGNLALQPPHPSRRTNLPPLGEQQPDLVPPVAGGAPREWSEMFQLQPPGVARIGEIRDALRQRDEQLKRKYSVAPDAPKWQPKYQDPFAERFAKLEKLPPPGELEFPKEEVKPMGFATRFLRDVGYSYASGSILGIAVGALRPKTFTTGERPVGAKLRLGSWIHFIESSSGTYAPRFAMWSMWYTLSSHFVFSNIFEKEEHSERAGVFLATAVSSLRYGRLVALASAAAVSAVVPIIHHLRDRHRESKVNRSFPQDDGHHLF